jgi:hypothetical protein
MSVVKVFLCGEGSNELGSRCGSPNYQYDSKPGVIETLLRGVQDQGWEVDGAIQWKGITKLRGPRMRIPREEQNVLGLVFTAKKKRARVLAFVRDADDDKQRPKVIAAAIDKAKEKFPDVEVIGGAAVPVLEAWILAMQGEHGTENLSKAAAQSKLSELKPPSNDTAAMVEIATSVTLEKLPKDATSLRAWLTRANDVLPPLVSAAQ